MFKWEHTRDDLSKIDNGATEVHLTFDSAAKRWNLRVYKRAIPVTYEIAWKNHYTPTREDALKKAEEILTVETPELNLNPV